MFAEHLVGQRVMTTQLVRRGRQETGEILRTGVTGRMCLVDHLVGVVEDALVVSGHNRHPGSEKHILDPS
jgi:hypothetical protein